MPGKLKNEALTPFQPDEATPVELYAPVHGNILAMMSNSAVGPEENEPILHGETVDDDHAVAASMPVEHSAVDASGHMDHHRRPIISVHGKDIDEHELDHKSAA